MCTRAMDDIQAEVETWIQEREPVEQDAVVDEFGRRGLSALRSLMLQDRVSYTLDWKLAIQQ